MNDLLEKIGLPIFVVIVILVIGWFVRSVLSLIAEQRSKLVHEVNLKILKELDAQLEEFYLPVREYLRLTYGLKITLDSLRNEFGKYDNSKLQIESEDHKALRNIAVQKIYLPINKKLASILMEKQHYKDFNDETDYQKILQHIILWESLEEAKLKGEIVSYSAHSLLIFPSEETDKQSVICGQLIEQRDKIRNKIINFKSNKLTKNKQNG